MRIEPGRKMACSTETYKVFVIGDLQPITDAARVSINLRHHYGVFGSNPQRLLRRVGVMVVGGGGGGGKGRRELST